MGAIKSSPLKYLLVEATAIGKVEYRLRLEDREISVDEPLDIGLCSIWRFAVLALK